MKKLFPALFVLGAISFAFAQNSSIDFKIRNLGIDVDGRFNTFKIEASFNEATELTGISGNITVTSISTGIEKRDEHLFEEDYFDTKSHKYITLKSTSIKKTTENTYAIEANLTIKGKTRSISITAKVEKGSGAYKITSAFEINRKDFDIGGGSFIMSKSVRLNVTHFQDF